ncbi:MAG: crossover junction endodeoxyribonuclease RuvC [Clostridia bacterium]|nr:crossover junction endodeoxyribonuclease RuvC [Clostridia bacterium]MDD4387296.1 crossover junction endodeoxyribonuclease RuvC [Clostridia bacterium]
MIVLGIDPGFARVGYGIIDYNKNKYKVIEYGSITTEANMKFSKRLNKIEKDLESICCKYKINVASVEKLFFNTNTKTGIQVAEARGVILNTMENLNIEVCEYTPLQIKQALVGYGRADKLQIKSMVKSFLNLEVMPKLDDTTDALAIAICHTHSYKMNDLLK